MDQHQLDRMEAPAKQGSILAHVLFRLHLCFNLPLILANPSIGFAWAGLLGRIAFHLSLIGPSFEDIRSLLGDLPKEQLREVAKKMTAFSFKNEVLDHTARCFGIRYVSRFIRFHRIEFLRDLHEKRLPAILICSHTGPRKGIIAGFYASRIPVLVMSAGKLPYPVGKKIEVCPISGGPGRHAFVLKRALDYLRAGGFVLMAIDAVYGGAITKDIAFMGRRLRFRRGVAALTRLTNAPLIPVKTRWASSGGAIDFHIGEPLQYSRPDLNDSDAFDHIVLKTVLQWLEDSIRSDPCQLQWHFLRRIIRAPVLPVEKV